MMCAAKQIISGAGEQSLMCAGERHVDIGLETTKTGGCYSGEWGLSAKRSHKLWRKLGLHNLGGTFCCSLCHWPDALLCTFAGTAPSSSCGS